MVGLGHESIEQFARDDLVLPPGFERRLGDDGPDAAVIMPAAFSGHGGYSVRG
jgi:hypothetical protein